MRTISRISLPCASAVLLVVSALGQLTIDVTGPVRERQRNPTFGSGGSSGRRLALQVTFEVQASSQDAHGRTYVDFTLTNNGKTSLTLPISPHPGDLEPKDAKATYTVEHLTLYLASETGSKAEKRSTVLPGGANLYGQSEFPETLTILKPGESVKFLTRVAVPHDSGTPSPDSITLVANAWLYQETIRPMGDQIKSEEEEIGSATSAERPSALFR
jgi:hypothetical protein